LQLGIGEAGVGKSIPEWEERIEAELVVASIANPQFLAEVNDPVDARILFG